MVKLFCCDEMLEVSRIGVGVQVIDRGVTERELCFGKILASHKSKVTLRSHAGVNGAATGNKTAQNRTRRFKHHVNRQLTSFLFSLPLRGNACAI